MLDINSLLKDLKRPRLLVQAARFGLEHYRRERDLLRLLDITSLPKVGEVIFLLLPTALRELFGKTGRKWQTFTTSWSTFFYFV